MHRSFDSVLIMLIPVRVQARKIRADLQELELEPAKDVFNLQSQTITFSYVPLASQSQIFPFETKELGQ